jgi:hypothetical protein
VDRPHIERVYWNALFRGIPPEIADLRALADDLRRQQESGARAALETPTPALTPEERRAIQLDRIRRQATRAATQTPGIARCSPEMASTRRG